MAVLDRDALADQLAALRVDLHIALRSVVRQKRQSLFGVLAVTFGVCAAILAGGFIDWILWAGREAAIHGGIGHIQIVRPGFHDGGLADPLRYLLPAASEVPERLQAIAPVTAVAASLSFSGLVSHGDATLAFLGEGVDVAGEQHFDSVVMDAGGQPLSASDPRGIVMGRGLAQNLGVGPGDSVVLLGTSTSGGINGVEARIRGLFHTVSSAYDDSAIRIPLPLAQQLLRTQGAHRWVVVLDDTRHTDLALRAILEVVQGKNLEVVSWRSLSDFQNKAEVLLSRQVGVVYLIIAAIIVLTISNTLTMNVMERIGEIGTGMALGVDRSTMLRRFLCEGLAYGLVGGALGCLAGWLLAETISYQGIPMPPPPGMSEGYVGRIRVSPGLVLTALALALSTTLVAAVYPARKASRLNIVDALRHNR